MPEMSESFRIIKTIRLNATDMVHLHSYTSYKIVVLARDPRAVINSMNTRPKDWGHPDFKTAFTDQFIHRICQRLVDFKVLYDSLPNKDDVLLVKYEILARTPTESAEKIYKFLGWMNAQEVIPRFLQSHFRLKEPPSLTLNSRCGH